MVSNMRSHKPYVPTRLKFTHVRRISQAHASWNFVSPPSQALSPTSTPSPPLIASSFSPTSTLRCTPPSAPFSPLHSYSSLPPSFYSSPPLPTRLTPFPPLVSPHGSPPPPHPPSLHILSHLPSVAHTRSSSDLWPPIALLSISPPPSPTSSPPPPNASHTHV